jgi:hypothetical protein
MTVKIDGSNGLLQNYDFQTLTTGFSYTFTSFNVLFANPAGTLATGTVTMPASPVDGMTVTITSTQQITALTINANTGQSIVAGGVVQLNANTNRVYLYRLANTTWYLLNIAAGNVVTSVNGSTGAVTLATGIQSFVANGTFTIPANVTSVKVTVVGGGGGGGSYNACYGGAAGGGAGAAAIKYLTGLTPGNTLAVTVGALGTTASSGGTSSVASGTQSITTITATGGGGGSYNVAGAGGAASGGDINSGGGSGSSTANFSGGSSGGGSMFGTGGRCVNGSAAVTAATAYGAGGGGGGVISGFGTNGYTGGSGAVGIVFFE